MTNATPAAPDRLQQILDALGQLDDGNHSRNTVELFKDGAGYYKEGGHVKETARALGSPGDIFDALRRRINERVPPKPFVERRFKPVAYRFPKRGEYFVNSQGEIAKAFLDFEEDKRWVLEVIDPIVC